MQVSRLLLPITKRVHYFYANQAFFSFKRKIKYIWYVFYLVFKKISTFRLKTLKLLQLKPIKNIIIFFYS
jgi:hypothetical protein